MTNKSFKIITLGCKVNQYESSYLRESLLNGGLREAPKGDVADVAVINTCAVTQRASCQSRQAIRKAIRENPSAMVAAVGCYAQAFPDELSQIRGLRLIAGNTFKGRLPGLLLDEESTGCLRVFSEEFGPEETFEFFPIKGLPDRARAFLKIQDGCQSHCTYCIVPLARGPSRSLGPAKVLSMLRSLLDEGYKEVVLTGVHLGRYGLDLRDGTDLKGLLRLIGREGLSLRVRLSSIEPNEIDRELVELMASEEWLCRHFHVPLQSGDDGILHRMNRHYTAGDFSRLVELIRKGVPYAAIGADTMAGFPGEDDGAFRQTYSLIEDLPISYLHVFPFSARRGTPAAGFAGQVHPETIKERAAELRGLGQKKRADFYGSCLGKEFSVLAEGRNSEDKTFMKGTSDNYLPVIFRGSEGLRGQFVAVRTLRVEKGKVVAEISGMYERRPAQGLSGENPP